MRVRTILLPMMIIFALLLAACGAQGNQNGDAVGTVFPETGETAAPGEIPETGSEFEVTEVPAETLEPAPTLDADAETTPELDVEPTVTVEATEAATAEATAAPTRDATGGLIGIPETGSGDLAGLSAMLDFQVEDTSGNTIGTVRDYVINMCEAHILYLVVEPEDAAGAADGEMLLIPYQATLETPNNGRVDAGQRLFVIDLDADALVDAPTVDFENLDLQNPQVWDADLLSYWKADFSLALTSACNVPVSGLDAGAANDAGLQTTPDANATPEATAGAGGAAATAQPGLDLTPTVDGAARGTDRQDVYRLALASDVLDAELQEGNGQLLGTLEEIAIVPETGRTQYLIFQPEDASQNELVALPPGAVNVMYDDSDRPVLVLLVDTNIYQNAPAFDRSSGAYDQDWFDYWDEYIPMTMEQLP